MSNMDYDFWMCSDLVRWQAGKVEEVGVYIWFIISTSLALHNNSTRTMGDCNTIIMVHLFMGARSI